MKKFYKILLCIALMVCLCMTVSAVGSSVTLKTATEEVVPGDSFTVEAVLENSDKILMSTVALNYDTNIFELTGGTCDVSGVSIGQVVPDKNAGTLLLKLPDSLSGKLFTFTFRVKDIAERGTYDITAKAAIGITKGEYIDVKGTQISVGCIHTPLEEWYQNKVEHWHICKDCGARIDVAEHTWEAEEKQCKVCVYKLADISNAETTVPTLPQQDASREPIKPIVPEDTVGTATEQGLDPTTGMILLPPTDSAAEQPQLPSATEEKTEGDIAMPEADDRSESSTAPWWILIMVLVFIGGVTGIVIFKKRNP